MPSYEMPLEEMKEYRGSSPCPKDFFKFLISKKFITSPPMLVISNHIILPELVRAN